MHRTQRVLVLVALAAAVALVAPSGALADVTVTERGRLADKHEPDKPEAFSSVLWKTGGSGDSLIDGSDLEFFINTDVTFTTAESASGSASDATYTHAVAASTSGGGTITTTLSDAFDGYNGVCFPDAPGLGECDPGDEQFEVYNDNGPASLGCDDCEFLFQDQTIGNLTVSRRTFVPDDQEFIRFMTLVTNNGAAAEEVVLLTANNLGSDDDTDVYDTSSGDDVVTVADHWIASFEAFDGDGESFDPRLGHVIQGPGGEVSVSSISFSDGQNQPYWEYVFTLQPGETGIIVNFATGQPNQPDAVAMAEELATLPDDALQCVTDEEREQILNFDAAPAPSVLEIPTATETGLAALVLLLLGSGLVLLHRQALG